MGGKRFIDVSTTLPSGTMKNRQVDQIDGDRNGGASAGKQDSNTLFRRIGHSMQLGLFCIHEKKDGYLCASSSHAGSTIRTYTHTKEGELGGFDNCARRKVVDRKSTLSRSQLLVCAVTFWWAVSAIPMPFRSINGW